MINNAVEGINSILYKYDKELEIIINNQKIDVYIYEGSKTAYSNKSLIFNGKVKETSIYLNGMFEGLSMINQ